MRSILGKTGPEWSDAAVNVAKKAAANKIVREAAAPGSTGHPGAGLLGSGIRKTGQELGQAVGQFGDATAQSGNVVGSQRDINYTPYPHPGGVQGEPIGIPHDREHLWGRDGGSTTPPPYTGNSPGTWSPPPFTGQAATPPPYNGPAINAGSPSPSSPKPKATGAVQYASPGSAVYSKPPAGPYVQGAGDPFARRPQLGADPFAGSRTAYVPPAPPGKGANPFQTPGANPFEVDPQAPPKILGRTAPREERAPGPIPSTVYPRGGDVGNMRNVLGDAAAVMNRGRKR